MVKRITAILIVCATCFRFGGYAQKPSVTTKSSKATSNLSRAFKKSAMLAKLATDQLNSKVREKEFNTYDEKHSIALTTAEADATTEADKHLLVLLLIYSRYPQVERSMLLKEQLQSLDEELQIEKAKMTGNQPATPTSTGEPSVEEVSRLKMLREAFLECGAHLDKSFSAGRYIGDGDCKRLDGYLQADNKP
jgi:hypothetical protein